MVSLSLGIVLCMDTSDIKLIVSSLVYAELCLSFACVCSAGVGWNL